MGDLCLWKILLRDVSSLVKADLNYALYGYDVETCEEDEEEVLNRLILSLRHVKELKIGKSCYKALAYLEAKGFIFPSNLKGVDVTSPLYMHHTDNCYDNMSTDGDSSDSDATDSACVESGDSEESVFDGLIV